MQSLSAFLLLCFVAFLNIFFFRQIGIFGVNLIFLGTWTLLFGLSVLRGAGKGRLMTVATAGAVLAVSSILSLWRLNETVGVLLLLLNLGTLVISTYALISDHPHVLALFELVVSPLLVIRSYFGSAITLLQGKAVSAEAKQKFSQQRGMVWKKFRPMIVGLFVAFPISFLLVSILSQADPVFASIVRDIVGEEFLENMLWRAVMSVVLLALGLPLLIMRRKEAFRNPLTLIEKRNFVTEYAVVMASVALVVALFLVIQGKYLFVPAVSGVDLSKYGIQTYSEYVNKGFADLLKASIFIFGLIWTGLILSRNKIGKEVMVLRGLQFFVMAEFIFFILSVFRRIVLYQQFHGMSLVRFYGGYFLLFLIGMTITLFLRHLVKMRFVVVEIAMACVLIAGLALFNVENYIAVLHPPTVNNRIDHIYLSRMSPDGYTGWKRSYDWANEVLNKQKPEEEMLNHDERMEVAYAGVVVKQLLRNTMKLTMELGSEQEKEEMFRSILLSISQRHEQKALKLSNTIEGQNIVLTNGTSQTPQSFSIEIAREKQAIQAAYMALEKKDYDKLQESIRVSGYSDRGDISRGMYASQFFYVYDNSTRGDEKRVLLDSILTWHPGKEVVYSQLRNQIQLNRLLELENMYLSSVSKIQSQPEGERGYKADISFDTPFLGSMN